MIAVTTSWTWPPTPPPPTVGVPPPIPPFPPIPPVPPVAPVAPPPPLLDEELAPAPVDDDGPDALLDAATVAGSCSPGSRPMIALHPASARTQATTWRREKLLFTSA